MCLLFLHALLWFSFYLRIVLYFITFADVTFLRPVRSITTWFRQRPGGQTTEQQQNPKNQEQERESRSGLLKAVPPGQTWTVWGRAARSSSGSMISASTAGSRRSFWRETGAEIPARRCSRSTSPACRYGLLVSPEVVFSFHTAERKPWPVVLQESLPEPFNQAWLDLSELQHPLPNQKLTFSFSTSPVCLGFMHFSVIRVLYDLYCWL